MKSRPLIISVLLLIILASCSEHKTEQSFKVEYVGALKNIMRNGDLSAKIDLSAFQSIENFYALGAFENLKGEIQVFDSKPINSFVQGGELMFDNSYSKSATLLVYSIVEEWISLEIPDNIRSKEDVEKYIEEVAEENNIDSSRPLPFRIHGIVKEVEWHVINWKDGDTVHSHEKHIASGLNGRLENADVELLGFYSDAHHAIFTHHTTNMHIHVKSGDGKIAGHADEIILGEKMILKLPKNIIVNDVN